MPNFPQDTMNKLALGGKKKKNQLNVCVFIQIHKEPWAKAGEQDTGRTVHLSKATVTSCGQILLKYLKVCVHFSSEAKVCGWESFKEN